jgi:hypothetical protein
VNKKYDNNNIIIASRAYFLRSPTCTRVNNLFKLAPLTAMAFWCYSYALHMVNLINGSDTFRSVLYLHIFCVITHYSSWYEIASYKLGLLVRPFVSWPRLCCHYCHTIELHGTSILGTTPSSLAASQAIIYLALVAVSVTMSNFETHPSYHGTFFHLIVPPSNSKQIA